MNIFGKKKINIAIVISNLGVGGAESQVIEIANHIDKNQFNLHVFLLSSHMPMSSRLIDRDERLHVIEKRWKYDVSVIPRLARKLKEYQIDIVHGFLFDAEIASRLAGKLAGCKAILGSERNIKSNNGKVKNLIYKHTSKLINLCVANSHAGVDFNRSVCGLPSSAYRVVHNGVDTKRFFPFDVSDLRASLQIGQQECVVGMFGSFKKQKNHQLLFKAAKQILSSQPETRFIIVGGAIHEGSSESNSYGQKLVDLIREFRIEDRFLFLGCQAKVENYYNLCDITVLPSLYEGTPNVALESMACGVPVVATDVSDNRIVIPDGQVGFIVPLVDEKELVDRLLMLITDQAQRLRMGVQARKWVETEFSLSQMTKKLGNVYYSAYHDKQLF